MKKIVFIFFTLVIMFTFAGCNNNIENNGHSSSEASGNSKNKSADEHNTVPIDNNKKTSIDNEKRKHQWTIKRRQHQ